MASRFNSSQRAALIALEGGVLRHSEFGWLAENESGAQLLSAAVVRWLLGERLLTRAGPKASTYRLSEHGEEALRAAREEQNAREKAASSSSVAPGTPLLLLNPDPHSEELDYLLALPLSTHELERHRTRLEYLPRLRELDADRFEFVQYRDDVFALPINPRLAAQELLPRGKTRLLPTGLADPGGLGIRNCPDRGVNYGTGWLQWFGGFDPEAPLIISERLGVEEFETLLAQLVT